MKENARAHKPLVASFVKYGVPDAIDVGQDSSPAAGLQTRQIRDVGCPAQAWTPAPLTRRCCHSSAPVVRESVKKKVSVITPEISVTDTPVSAPDSAESRAATTLREIFESGRPLTYVRSAEEQRVARVLRDVGGRLPGSSPVPVWTWSLTEGMRREGGPAERDTTAARAALDFIAAHAEAGIFHLKDFHEPLRDSPEIRRRLRDLHEICLDRRKFVVITSPVRFIPQELQRTLVFVELRPPDVIELSGFLREELGRVARSDGAGADAATFEQLARALQGLTLDEARYALRRALSASPRLGPEALPALLEEKRLLVNRSGVVEFIADHTAIADVGGLDGLKTWLLERRKLFQLRDSVSAEIVPKGVLLMGIPGCGKSLCVKAIASCFELPLYRIDMIEIFSGRHGKPEGVFVEACRMLEDMAPAVLWFDEIEMGVTSAESGGEQGRIFAFFLTWMQEKARGLFVAATANRIDLLPAEMIRKGRFDEVFFVDLPLDEERVDIFKIHLARRGVDPARFNLEQLIQFTQGWAGAEIEQCVVSAITKARLAEREITEQDLISTAVSIVPLSRTMKEQINHIRGWAFERAIRASPKAIRR
jgi:SpoVK/Ycf46/Vps4 family AAA+-type ATPase